MDSRTTRCPECQGELNRRAIACPGCGVAGPRLRWWLGVVAILAPMLVILGATFVYAPVRWVSDPIVTATGQTAGAQTPPRWDWITNLEPVRDGGGGYLQGDRFYWPWLVPEHAGILTIAASLLAWHLAAHRRRYGR